MYVALTVMLMVGFTTLWWSTVGLFRWMKPSRLKARSETGEVLTPADVAILIAAHNEELVISHTLESACSLVSPQQVFVVSDASSDRTAEITRSYGAQCLELVENRGKAGALVAGLEHFRIAENYPVVMLLDADSRPAPNYLATGLNLFRQPGVVAVAGRAITWPDAELTWKGRLLTTYRERTYVAVQTLHKFGQAASRANAVAIAPGFASMYRSEILEHVDIEAPGLAIEDYNMTFEVHAKRLGRVAFDPRAAWAYTQDPDSFRDYTKQMTRWSLGFWQTLMRHRVQVGVFWASVSTFALEVVLSSLLLVLVVPVLVLDQVRLLLADAGVDRMSGWGLPFDSGLLLVGVMAPDFVLSLYVAIATRKLRFLTMSPIFPLLRIVDSWVTLKALYRALRGSSSGVWSSPTRRAA